MLSKVSYESEVIEIRESYNQNFVLNNLTLPLARKLAVAAFIIDFRSEERQIKCSKTDDAIHNAGHIIIEGLIKSPVISGSSPGIQKSSISSHSNCKMPVPGIRSSVESHDYMPELRIRHRLISIFSAIWKNLFDNKPGM